MPFSPDLERFFRAEETSRAIADIFDELANHGRFDNEGGELSQDDWDDARAR